MAKTKDFLPCRLIVMANCRLHIYMSSVAMKTEALSVFAILGAAVAIKDGNPWGWDRTRRCDDYVLRIILSLIDPMSYTGFS
jgi:hypothetical protein